MHAVDADEEYMAISGVVEIIVGVGRLTGEDCQDCQTRAERDQFDAHASPPWALVLNYSPTVAISCDCKVTAAFLAPFSINQGQETICSAKYREPSHWTAPELSPIG